MAEPERPQSPFAGMADFSARPPVRVLSPDEIEQTLASHRLYLETEYHEGHRANFSSADLTRRDFSGLNLRGIKMDRAVLRGADFTGAYLQSANLIGAICQEACFDRADLSRARLTDANLDGVEGFMRGQLDRAHLNSGTQLPDGLEGREMPNNDHVPLLSRGAAVWNERRAKHDETPDLARAGLRGLDLSGFDFSQGDLRDADLRGTNLTGANLSGAHLEGANLFKAVLDGADLAGAFFYRVQFLNCAQHVVARNW